MACDAEAGTVDRTGVKARRLLHAGEVIMGCHVQTLKDKVVSPEADVAPNDHCLIFDLATTTWFIIADHSGPRCDIYNINSSVGQANENCLIMARTPAHHVGPLPPHVCSCPILPPCTQGCAKTGTLTVTAKVAIPAGAELLWDYAL